MLFSRQSATIPIITYHKISDKKEIGLTTVTPVVFRQQMQYLAEHQFQTITFNNIFSGETLPEKPIMITFDDGYESVYHYGLPVLADHGFNAVIYIITDFVGRLNSWEAVSWQRKFKHLDIRQIKELQEQGFEIGSHGKRHSYLPAQSSMKIRIDALESRKYLEDITGAPVLSFCYPYGRYTKRVKLLIAEAGYRYAIHNLKLFKSSQKDPLAMMRRSIYLSDTDKSFARKVTHPEKLTRYGLQEILIQKGALASIAINLLTRNNL